MTKGPTMPPQNLPDSAYSQSRQTYKGPDGEAPVVDRVALCTDRNNNLCIKYMFRHTRRPELADKFGSRYGIGVCGLIIPQEDFAFSERGICPDLKIPNPHGFPRWMGAWGHL